MSIRNGIQFWIRIILLLFMNHMTHGDSMNSVELSHHLDWDKVFQEAQAILQNKSDCFDKGHYFECDTRGKYPPGSSIWNSRSVCDCGKKCMDYGGCCLDLARSLSDKGITPANKYKCGHLTIESGSTGFLMVDKCNPSYYNSTIEPLCLRTVRGKEYGHLLDIPTVSASTNAIYVNFYCAVCNDDADHLIPSHLDVRCSDSSKQKSTGSSNEEFENTPEINITEFISVATYHPDRHKWKQDFQGGPFQNISCTLLNLKHGFGPERKSSFENCTFPTDIERRSTFWEENTQINECDENWTNSEDRIKCSSYTLRVFNAERSLAYKNPHCAMCNSVNISDENISCRKRDLRRTFRPFGGPVAEPPPFSVLFQVPCTPWKICRRNMIWSPIENRCVEFYCAKQYTKENGKCILSENKTITDSDSVVLEGCPKVSYAYGQSNFLENGSLIIENQIIEPKKYKIMDNFTLLVCTRSLPTEKAYMTGESETTYIVFIISEVCLAFHLFLFCKAKSPRSTHKKNLFCLCLSLFIAQLIFLVGIRSNVSYEFCFVISVLLHFSWLSSFFWMNILSIDIFRTFCRMKPVLPQCNTKSFYMYSSYAWGTSLLVVGLASLADILGFGGRLQPEYASGPLALCWINNRGGILIYFLIPISIIILENCVLFVFTSVSVYRQAKETRFAYDTSQSVGVSSRSSSETTKRQVRRKNTVRFALYAKLGLLQGVVWCSAFVAYFVNSPTLWDLFTVFAGLQGAYIFIFFDLRKMWAQNVWTTITTLSSDLRTTISSSQSKSSSSGRSHP